jgi:hypothetical protein
MRRRFPALAASELSTAQLARARNGVGALFERARAKGANTHRVRAGGGKKRVGRDDEFEGVPHSKTATSAAARDNGVGPLHVLTRSLECVDYAAARSNPLSL